VPEAPSPGPLGVPGGDPNGKTDGVLNSILDASAGPPPPTPAPTAPRRLLISHYDPGMVIRQVKPVYPHTALITHTEGIVVLRAIVGKDGTVQDLRVISGSPLLVSSAVDAVRQWQFKPYFLNGLPIEVETQVTVNFVINR
jgi:protein TonB